MTTKPETLLIIEDNSQIASLFSDMFRNCDLNLVCLRSIDLYRLSDILNEYQPCAVIMDYISIHRQYDAVVNSIPPHIPTVLLTPIADRKFANHVDYCIKKPFAPSEIYAVMSDITAQVY